MNAFFDKDVSGAKAKVTYSWEEFLRPALFCLIFIYACNFPCASAEDLIEVYNQAVREDPKLEQAKENLEAVQETKTQTTANLFLPEATITAGINTDWQRINNRGGAVVAGSNGRTGRIFNENFGSSNYSLNVTQPILHYDRIVQWQQSDHQIAQAIAQYAASESDLLLRVAQNYLAILAAKDNLIYTQAQADTLGKKLNEIKEVEAAGYLAITDVQEAQSGYDSAAAEVIGAEQQVRDAIFGLQEITGVQYGSLARLKADIPLVQPEPKIEERWVSQALSHNLGIKASEYASKIADAQVEVQKAGHWPTLDATGSHSFSSSGGRFGAADVEDNTVGLQFNFPIFSGGKVNSRVRQAEHQYYLAMATLKQEQRAAQRAASQAFLGVITGVRRVQALQQTLKSSEIGLKATEEGFRSGYRTPLDVIIAQRQRINAQRDYAKARYDYILSALRLKQAVGALSPDDLIKVNSWLENTEPAAEQDQKEVQDGLTPIPHTN